MKSGLHLLCLAAVALVAAACSDDANDPKEHAATGKGARANAESHSAAETESSLFAIGSLVTDPNGDSSGYLKLVSSLDRGGERLELDDAREFAGQSDIWVEGGSVFVASGDEPSITKYDVSNEGELRERGTISFSNYGIASAAFWNNAFVSDRKAYMQNSVSEYIVWNPSTMQIEGTVKFPDIENKGELEPRVSFADRGVVVYDGKLYQPVYWTNKDFSGRTEASLILVVDTDTDEVVDQLTVDCTGLDYGTKDESGHVYFSNWTGTVGTHLVLETPPTCFATVDVESNEITTTKFADVTGGHEGAALKYAGDGMFVMSVFHEGEVKLDQVDDPFELVAEPHFHLYRYDPKSRDAKPIDDVGANTGAIYHAAIGGKFYSLVPGANYDDTTVYELSAGTAKPAFGITGWSIRLFEVR